MPIYTRRAYTLVEIVIVVTIIAVLLAIIVPNYFKAGKSSAKNVCINNLKKIDAAIDQWAIDNSIAAGTIPSRSQEDDIYGYVKSGKPECPSKGDYAIHAVGSKPQVTCGKEDEGHKLPE